MEKECIDFLLWSMKNYTYYDNFGFRDEFGVNWTVEEIYNHYLTSKDTDEI